MTLIAAFPVMGTPALLGDLLITSKSGQSSRKKVVLIADNFAIAWTGDLLAAQIVISELKCSLVSTSPTLAWLQTTLTSLDPKIFGHFGVVIVGWLVEPIQAHCFRWRSDYVHNLFFEDVMIDGSGADFIAQNLGPAGLAGDGSVTPDYVRRRHRLVVLIGELMRSELHGPTTRASGFGHGYEALLLNECRVFEYVEVLYYSIAYKMTPAGMLESFRLIQPVVKVSHTQGFTLIWTNDTAMRQEKRELITAPAETRQNLEQQIFADITSLTNRFDFRSDNYCQFVYFESSGIDGVPIAIVHGDAMTVPKLVSHGDGRLEVQVSRKQTEFFFQTIKADLAARNGPSQSSVNSKNDA